MYIVTIQTKLKNEKSTSKAVEDFIEKTELSVLRDYFDDAYEGYIYFGDIDEPSEGFDDGVELWAATLEMYQIYLTVLTALGDDYNLDYTPPRIAPINGRSYSVEYTKEIIQDLKAKIKDSSYKSDLSYFFIQ